MEISCLSSQSTRPPQTTTSPSHQTSSLRFTPVSENSIKTNPSALSSSPRPISGHSGRSPSWPASKNPPQFSSSPAANRTSASPASNLSLSNSPPQEPIA